MSYGIKVSKDGFDVKAATLSKLSLDSDYTNLKVFMQGSISLVTTPYKNPDDPGNFVVEHIYIQHNLGYAPGFWVYGINNDTDNTLLKSEFPSHGEIGVGAVSNDTNLIIQLEMAVWAMTTDLWKGYYYIFTNRT